MITELRKELRLSNEEHRELLARVNADNLIQRIRYDWMMKKIFLFFANETPFVRSDQVLIFFFVFNVYDFG